MSQRLRALSVTQPYATNIIHDGKDVENRGWGPRGVSFPFWMAIHATKEDTGLPRDRYPLGCIMGVARVARVLHSDSREAAERRHADPWAMADCYLWVMDRKIPLTNTVPCKGRLMLWWVDGELGDRVIAELGPEATTEVFSVVRAGAEECQR